MALPMVTFEGRLGADPELRFTQGGTAVCSLRTVASSRKKEGDEWVDDKVCWVDVTVFGKYAENVVESLVKGDLVYVAGRLQQETWEDRDTKAQRSKHVIIADEVSVPLRFRTIKHGEGRAERAAAPANDDPWGAAPAGDEPPF
jgi:single-strand DNA-binding protein